MQFGAVALQLAGDGVLAARDVLAQLGLGLQSGGGRRFCAVVNVVVVAVRGTAPERGGVQRAVDVRPHDDVDRLVGLSLSRGGGRATSAAGRTNSRNPRA